MSPDISEQQNVKPVLTETAKQIYVNKMSSGIMIEQF